MGVEKENWKEELSTFQRSISKLEMDALELSLDLNEEQKSKMIAITLKTIEANSLVNRLWQAYVQKTKLCDGCLEQIKQYKEKFGEL